MSGIRDIAKLANVSNGTVSAVLNGKGDALRIAAATRERVWEAARALNYRPNIPARRLRTADDTGVPVVALFWTWDTRSSLMGRFLKGIQSSPLCQENGVELLIQPYASSCLGKELSLLRGTRFNGAIIANATELDLAYLSQVNLPLPVVLYQRSQEGYRSIQVDHYASGCEVAELFHAKGFRQVGLITPHVSSQAIQLRQEGFVETAERLGMLVAGEHRLLDAFSEQGGYEAAARLSSGPPLPEALFVLCDQMAIGALTAFRERGIEVPGQIQVVGYDDSEGAAFTVPSLTSVHLPVERMAAAAIGLLAKLIDPGRELAVIETFATHIVYRNSCPEVKNL
ncbi:LacI family DNA-binding transcriptional regulator [Paenibacillus contaminans]|uniref:LacI family transcriptional regulator n=1 Tax=Paenibacillus contaminans TaxID=450362 RepID=A0A329LSJ8_9BACL|nr:LacI family DNA-binding transcriptional regulator [Paenibacillus contaminans]RAV10901.1 LacI family transcriptional regulator [Paenibacillus contaminans]